MKVKIKVNTHKNGTTYFNTEVGRSLILRGLANDEVPSGKLELPSKFAKRQQADVAFNASTFNMDLGELRGVIIHNGKIIQDKKNTIKRPYLVFYLNGSIGHLPHDFTAIEMINLGVVETLIGFFPIIFNGKDSLKDFSYLYPFKPDVLNPQQVIYQKGNDIGFLTSNGRLEDEPGLSVNQLIEILIEKEVDFAYLLDGGGSTAAVVNGKTINKIDSREREVADFLYLNGDDDKLVDIVELQKDVERLKKQSDVQRVDDIEKIKKTGDYWLARTSKGLPKNDNFAMKYTALSDEVGILVAYPFSDTDGLVYKNTRRSGKLRGWYDSLGRKVDERK